MKTFPSFIAIHRKTSPSLSFNILNIFAGTVVLCLYFLTVTYEVREASLALGATRWQTVKHVVMRRAFPGVAAAIILGFSRAFGETMAVLMVVGNVPITPSSVFDPAYPLPALIANTYGDVMSIPLYDSAMLLASLVLLLVVLFFNVVARIVLRRLKRRSL